MSVSCLTCERDTSDYTTRNISINSKITGRYDRLGRNRARVTIPTEARQPVLLQCSTPPSITITMSSSTPSPSSSANSSYQAPSSLKVNLLHYPGHPQLTIPLSSLASSLPYLAASSSVLVSFSRRRVCCARRPGTKQARVSLT